MIFLIRSESDSLALPHESEMQQMMEPLTEEEMDELDSFLMSDATSVETMILDTLDGFLTVITTGPVTLRPSEWLPMVWGSSEEAGPKFETAEQAERITGLIFRHLNGITSSIQHDPDAFEPVFDMRVHTDSTKESADGEMWANGFMAGIDLQPQNWKAFFDHPDSSAVFRPIYFLGADEVSDEKEELTKTRE